jgi:outer membrane protein OmpA-like peptidoglycan-associated protein
MRSCSVKALWHGKVVASGAARTRHGIIHAARPATLGEGQQALVPTQGMFGPNVPQLTPYGQSYLTYVAKHIDRAARVTCVGYTAAPGDNLSNDPFSLSLSRQRAEVACAFLRQHHVSAEYVTEGLGKADPLAPNTTPANLARNRRVEFRVISGLTLNR